MDRPAKPDLLETGTRFDHYMELRDNFSEAIVILVNTLKTEDNQSTRDNIKKLQTAINLIEARVNFLSDFVKETTRYSTFGKTLEGIAPNRPAQLPECSESTRKACEEEMRKARENGYAEDSGAKGSENGQGGETANT